uniref:Serpentine Receptor, class H n=1 Tax=Caenorhabditis tropicalis TaxID=1561998 RepID=A0A1I7UBG1_9PELO
MASKVFWSDYVESSCRQNYSYFHSADFMITVYHFMALFTIPFSIFTFYVIIRVTPKKMENMKVPMLIAHVWSTNLDLCFTVYAAPFTFFPGASGLPLGLLAVLEMPSKWIVYIGHLSVIIMSVNFVILLENRHSQISIIKFKIPNQRIRTIFFIVNYLLAFLYILPFYLDDEDQLKLRSVLLNIIKCPSIEFYNKHTVVLVKGGELSVLISVTSGLIIVIGQAIFFSGHSVYHLNYAENANVSEATKALQRKFLGYVIMQMTIPWTVLVCPILYSLYAYKYDYYNQAFNNISMIIMSMHGLLSTSCILYIIKPYREFVLSIIKRNNDFNANEMWATTAQPSSIKVGVFIP